MYLLLPKHTEYHTEYRIGRHEDGYRESGQEMLLDLQCRRYVPIFHLAPETICYVCMYCCMHIPRTVVIIIIIILVVVLPLLYCWYVLFSHLLDTWPPHCFHNTAFHFVLLDPIVMLGICHPIVFYFYVLVFVTAQQI